MGCAPDILSCMQFQVPQFIEVEDKIFGPLTFKQFVYVAGGAGMAYLLWRVFPVYVAVPLAIGVLGLGALLAFFQYNGQPFILAVEHAFFYVARSKLYLWSNDTNAKPVKMNAPEAASAQVYVPKLSDSKLHELAWSLDINERIAAGVSDDSGREAAAPFQGLVAPVRTAREALIQ